MKSRFTRLIAVFMLLAFWNGASSQSSGAANDQEPNQPHTPTLIFYISGAQGSHDADALGVSVQKLQGAKVVDFNADRGYVRVRFDSHVVSYHQVAQAIAEAGKTLGKTYDPYLVFTVKDYGKPDNAAKVDAVFAGKRLNQRVHVTPLDKAKGVFAIHFLALTVDPKDPSPQGFNGGHLHHPISDPPPRGLGLESGYASEDDASLAGG
jgi:copper chaperone CopZ